MYRIFFSYRRISLWILNTCLPTVTEKNMRKHYVIDSTYKTNEKTFLKIKWKKQSRKMYASSLIVFLTIVLPLYVHTKVENISDNYLPLVLIITQNDELQFPNQIVKADIQENIGFTGGTQFSTKDFKEQIFFCPPESDEEKNQIEEYDKLLQTSSYAIKNYYRAKKASENCLFSKTFEKDDPLRCAKDATPVIYFLKKGEPGEEKVQKCGPGEEAVLLKFVYELCVSITPFGRFMNYIKSASLFLSKVEKFTKKLPFVYMQKTVYEICYHHENKKTIYTKHTLSPINSLFDEQLEHEKEKKHIMMTEATEIYYIKQDFSKLEEFYKDLLKNPPIKQNQSSKEETPDIAKTHDVYLPEKLVPPDDFMLSVLKKATFHYINVQPMHQNLVELWNYTAELIRKSLLHKKTKNPIEIYTGAFTLTEIGSQPFLLEKWPPGVPEIWIKIIYTQARNPFKSLSLVIVMRNNDEPTEEGSFDYVLDKACGFYVDHCKSFKQDDEVFKKFSNLLKKIRCCPLNANIAAFFYKHFTHGNAILPIDGLTDEKE